MLKNVPILILDEATAFADPDNEAKVQAAFAQLAKGKTVLMIAHRLSTVANADCIYVVQDGQIVESGTKDELCAQNGLFARMWQEYQASVQWKVAKEGEHCPYPFEKRILHAEVEEFCKGAQRVVVLRV